MTEKTIFPREEKTDLLFKKILDDPWACDKLFDTFCNSLFCNDGVYNTINSKEFTKAMFNSYHNRDLSAFLMAICQNTVFDLLRNASLIPYRFNADGKQNPIIMTDNDLNNKKNIYFAQAYRYSHSYQSDDMKMEQDSISKTTGVLLIRELPDTIKQKESEAEAYYAIWDIMIELEKNLPMAIVFYGQDSLIEENTRYDELGIFLPNSHFLKNLEKHVEKAEAIIYEQH